MKLEKRIKNSSGDLLIRGTSYPENIVEILHLYNGDSGCVIAFFEKRECDDTYIAELKSVHSRIAETIYDDAEILLQAIKYGQKLADLILASDELKKE